MKNNKFLNPVTLLPFIPGYPGKQKSANRLCFFRNEIIRYSFFPKQLRQLKDDTLEEE